MNIFKRIYNYVLIKFRPPYVLLSRKDTDLLWKKYCNCQFNGGQYKFIRDFIKDEFKGISAVEWTTTATDEPFDQLKLTFEKEQYKTWFLLNWEYHD